ncbi:hypothetical protein M758_2G237300 [Ceratodon purpureus]|nr:hypothetical protein M758_2G237300 [Ceratodon purpureus]
MLALHPCACTKSTSFNLAARVAMVGILVLGFRSLEELHQLPMVYVSPSTSSSIPFWVVLCPPPSYSTVKCSLTGIIEGITIPILISITVSGYKLISTTDT